MCLEPEHAGHRHVAANVNPEVPTPSYGQATERRIGEFFMRRTLMFNGYRDQVAPLHTGVNLRKFF